MRRYTELFSQQNVSLSYLAMLIIGHGLWHRNRPDNNRPSLGFAVIY